MEGGFSIDDLMRQAEPLLCTPVGALEVAISLETQALDLYLLLAERVGADCRKAETQRVLLTIARQERGHIARVAHLLEDELRR